MYSAANDVIVTMVTAIKLVCIGLPWFLSHYANTGYFFLLLLVNEYGDYSNDQQTVKKLRGHVRVKSFPYICLWF